MGGLPCCEIFSAIQQLKEVHFYLHYSCALRGSRQQHTTQCAKRTVILCPDGKWLPGAGHCWRATPLPIALISNPDCWALSTAERSGLPKNDGTTTPLSTSRTTVPFAASRCVRQWRAPSSRDWR